MTIESAFLFQRLVLIQRYNTVAVWVPSPTQPPTIKCSRSSICSSFYSVLSVGIYSTEGKNNSNNKVIRASLIQCVTECTCFRECWESAGRTEWPETLRRRPTPRRRWWRGEPAPQFDIRFATTPDSRRRHIGRHSLPSAWTLRQMRSLKSPWNKPAEHIVAFSSLTIRRIVPPRSNTAEVRQKNEIIAAY